MAQLEDNVKALEVKLTADADGDARRADRADAAVPSRVPEHRAVVARRRRHRERRALGGLSLRAHEEGRSLLMTHGLRREERGDEAIRAGLKGQSLPVSGWLVSRPRWRTYAVRDVANGRTVQIPKSKATLTRKRLCPEQTPASLPQRRSLEFRLGVCVGRKPVVANNGRLGDIGRLE